MSLEQSAYLADIVASLATDRKFADLWVKGGSEFDSLDSEDKQRLVIWEFQALAGRSKYFNLRQQALISDAQWAELVGTFAHSIDSQ